MSTCRKLLAMQMFLAYNNSNEFCLGEMQMISVLTKANPKGYSSIALEDLTSFVSNTAVLV